MSSRITSRKHKYGEIIVRAYTEITTKTISKIPLCHRMRMHKCPYNGSKLLEIEKRKETTTTAKARLNKTFKRTDKFGNDLCNFVLNTPHQQSHRAYLRANTKQRRAVSMGLVGCWLLGCGVQNAGKPVLSYTCTAMCCCCVVTVCIRCRRTWIKRMEDDCDMVYEIEAWKLRRYQKKKPSRPTKFTTKVRCGTNKQMSVNLQSCKTPRVLPNASCTYSYTSCTYKRRLAALRR